jgi:hypothetical protein
VLFLVVEPCDPVRATVARPSGDASRRNPWGTCGIGCSGGAG